MWHCRKHRITSREAGFVGVVAFFDRLYCLLGYRFIIACFILAVGFVACCIGLYQQFSNIVPTGRGAGPCAEWSALEARMSTMMVNTVNILSGAWCVHGVCIH